MVYFGLCKSYNFIMKRFILIFCSVIFAVSLLCGNVSAGSEPLGTVGELLVSSGDVDSQLEETPLGATAADAAQYVSDADAVIINGGVFSANLMGGEVTYQDCRSVFGEDLPLYTAEVSPAELRAILEYCVSAARVTPEEALDREASRFDCFPQISGFSFLYDLSAPSGDRVVWIRHGEQELDLNDTSGQLLLCTTEPVLSGAGVTGQVLPEETLTSALASYIEKQDGPLGAPGMDRIRTRGSRESGIFESLHISPLLLLVALICFGAVGSYPFKKYYDFKR